MLMLLRALPSYAALSVRGRSLDDRMRSFMDPLYKLHPARSYLSVAPLQPKQVVRLASRYNREKLTHEWVPMSYVFVDSEDGKNLRPSTCWTPPAVLVRAELKREIFPYPCPELEFLPVKVGPEEWLSLSCSKTTSRYDPIRSVFLRDPRTSEIIFIHKLVVQDASVRECEIFTLDDSNRATLIVLESFKRRIEDLQIGGISFERIGALEVI